MKWITGYTQAQAQALDAEMLTNARARLGTYADIFGAFKHPDTAEWCVPWDEERAAIAPMVANQSLFLQGKTLKVFDQMKIENWIKEGAIGVTVADIKL